MRTAWMLAFPHLDKGRAVSILPEIPQPVDRETLHVTVWGSQPTIGTAPRLVMVTEGLPPDIAIGPGWFENMRNQYKEQGKAILDALLRTVPGGTIDGLAIAILEHQASVRRIPDVQQ